MARDGWHYLPSLINVLKQKKVLLCAVGAAECKQSGQFVELTNEGPNLIFPCDFYLMVE